MIRPRKAHALFGSTMAVGLVFVVAGTSFACTKCYGTITGWGNGVDNATTSVAGNPDAGTFEWCEDPAPFETIQEAGF